MGDVSFASLNQDDSWSGVVLITGEQPASERFELSGISPQAGKYTLYGAALLQVDKCNLASQTLQDNGGRTLVGDIGVPSVQVCIHQAIHFDMCFALAGGCVLHALSLNATQTLRIKDTYLLHCMPLLRTQPFGLRLLSLI